MRKESQKTVDKMDPQQDACSAGTGRQFTEVTAGSTRHWRKMGRRKRLPHQPSRRRASLALAGLAAYPTGQAWTPTLQECL